MGVVIRMNMAGGLDRAELSWAQAVVRNRCQLTHICMLGLWSVMSQLWSPQGHCTSGAPKIIGFFSWFTVSPDFLSAAVSLLTCLSCQCMYCVCTHMSTVSTNPSIIGFKSEFQTLISRSKVLAGLTYTVTATSPLPVNSNQGENTLQVIIAAKCTSLWGICCPRRTTLNHLGL